MRFQTNPKWWRQRDILSPIVTAPGRLTIQAPRSANPGDYPLRVTGACLPLKRWLHKAGASIDNILSAKFAGSVK